MSKTNLVEKENILANDQIINEKIKKNIGKNINRDYLFSFLRSFDLTSGVWMLYLALS